MATKSFETAKRNKADEFYTQWVDIEREVKTYLEFNLNVFKDKTILCPCDDPYESNFFKYFALHFNNFGLKKLIATCYIGSPVANTQLTLFDDEPEDTKTTRTPHKIVITEVADYNADGTVDLTDVKWLLTNKMNALTRLEGDGDFRSDEIKALRDEADFIITNPPFSLFREFMAWTTEAQKQYLIISNMNAITYKEIFPLIKDNRMWMGLGFGRSFQGFIVPKSYPLNGSEARIDEQGNRIVSTNNTIWLTNIDHGRRHQPLQLMTIKQNLKTSKHKEIKGKKNYDKYDNYDAIDVPFTDAIPSDYDGVMGVPISFLYKYCPEQFDIIKFRKGDDDKDLSVGGKCPYFRILIKNKNCCEKRSSSANEKKAEQSEVKKKLSEKTRFILTKTRE
ncbi:MAG: adenine-specific methyltransferase EcoRI family protein [Oscillospiraceae bacterium]|nr:adenine-specific methyltransferase EcoRI family protein [Oscillospiraceae bacterium]